MKWTKRKILFLVACVLLTIFVIIFKKIDSGTIVAFDNFVYGLLEHNEILTKIMKIVTWFGESYTLIFLSVALFLFFTNKREAAAVPLNLALIATCNATLKILVKRPRPIGIRLIDVTGYSFPSGHSASSFAFYGFLMYLIYRKCKNKKLKILSMSFLGVLIFAIGVSRIYLGVHYASDVFGGFALAGFYLILYVLFCDRHELVK